MFGRRVPPTWTASASHRQRTPQGNAPLPPPAPDCNHHDPTTVTVSQGMATRLTLLLGPGVVVRALPVCRVRLRASRGGEGCSTHKQRRAHHTARVGIADGPVCDHRGIAYVAPPPRRGAVEGLPGRHPRSPLPPARPLGIHPTAPGPSSPRTPRTRKDCICMIQHQPSMIALHCKLIFVLRGGRAGVGGKVRYAS